MLYQIKEVTEKIVDVNLESAKYVSFMNTIFWQFFPKGNKITVTYFCLEISGDNTFQLSVREPNSNDWEHFNLVNDKTKEITSTEFFDTLHNALLKHQLFPIPTLISHLRPDADDLKDTKFR